MNETIFPAAKPGGYTDAETAALAARYRATLVDDVLPFWLRHGLDREHGGFLTCLGRAGELLDSDKAVWLQGRAAWMFATAHRTVERRPEWLEASRSALDFLRRHAFAPDGKMYFTLTREGRPLRMRRYVFSECFAAIGAAARARAGGDERAAAEARRAWAAYLRYTFTPGLIAPKTDPAVRPMKGLAPLMIAIVTAQELRANLGELEAEGATCTAWIDRAVAEIERDFMKPEFEGVLECVGPNGEFLDHFDGRIMNPGHAIEAAWFILHEARVRGGDARLLKTGLTILDWMWKQGWDAEHGGIFYFRDARGLPVQEYWHDMKFWWPHNEAEIATLLAWRLTGEPRYADWHRQVHAWSFGHFADPQFGEWYGYLHRDGRVSVPLKGNLWKGPFHLPRMLSYNLALLTGTPTAR
jgi:N-acylglucosamine 2-epimerase